MSDMDGKVTRVGASERGQRTSFKKPRYRGKAKVDFTKPVHWRTPAALNAGLNYRATPNLLWIGLTRRKLVTHT